MFSQQGYYFNEARSRIIGRRFVDDDQHTICEVKVDT